MTHLEGGGAKALRHRDFARSVGSSLSLLQTTGAASMSSPSVRAVSPVAPEEPFRCCICLHVYSSPVSTPCGHNYCLGCIQGYWDASGRCHCPLCKQAFRTRPELSINREFERVIELIQRSLSPAEPNGPRDTDQVPCDVCPMDRAAAVSSCLVCQASYCEPHLTPHRQAPALQRHRLTDPATFAGSHLCRSHSQPLTMFCKKDQRPVCVRCAAGSHRHHEVVPMEKESRRVKSQLRATKSSVQQMVQTRLRKIEEISNSVELSEKITEREVQSSVAVCAGLTAAVHACEAALVDELRQRQAEAERTAREALDELQREIGELQARAGELQQLELVQNPLHLLQGFPSVSVLPSTRDWSEVTVHSENCVGSARRAVSALVGVCQEVVDKLAAEEADKMAKYAVDVTLDPETASGWLVLSPDGKKVSLSSQKKTTSLPDSPQRFDTCVCVLGKQSFSSGRRYWEVQVGDKTDWDVGVARDAIARKGAITVRPSGGYWVVCRRRGGSLSACTSPSTPLRPHDAPQRVGVFLDYEGGAVSFYDAETKAHLYTFGGCSFGGPLKPYFNPCVQDNGRNATPLVICPLGSRSSSGDGRQIIME